VNRGVHPDDPYRRGLRAPRLLQIGQGADGPAAGVELSEEAIYAGLLVLPDAGHGGSTTVAAGGGARNGDAVLCHRVGMQMIGEWPRLEWIVTPLTLAVVLERLAEDAPADEQVSARSVSCRLRAGPGTKPAPRWPRARPRPGRGPRSASNRRATTSPARFAVVCSHIPRSALPAQTQPSSASLSASRASILWDVSGLSPRRLLEMVASGRGSGADQLDRLGASVRHECPMPLPDPHADPGERRGLQSATTAASRSSTLERRGLIGSGGYWTMRAVPPAMSAAICWKMPVREVGLGRL